MLTPCGSELLVIIFDDMKRGRKKHVSVHVPTKLGKKFTNLKLLISPEQKHTGINQEHVKFYSNFKMLI